MFTRLPRLSELLILIGDIFAKLVELSGCPGAPVYECCHDDQVLHSDDHRDRELPEPQQEVE